MDRDMLLDKLLVALSRDARVAAVWLDGSLARGAGDEHSDVDLVVAAEDAELDSFLRSLPELFRSECDAVLVQTRGRLLNFVTTEWARADIFVRTRGDVAAGVPGPISVLHDPDGCVRIVESPVVAPTGRLVPLVEEFIRFLGLLPAVARRDEWIGAYAATGTMAGMVTELMQIENGTHRIGGALRLSDRLTDQQSSALRDLPALTPDRESVLAVQAALAKLFLPRARRVAETLGVAYPDTLETAVLQHLRRFGLDLSL